MRRDGRRCGQGEVHWHARVPRAAPDVGRRESGTCILPLPSRHSASLLTRAQVITQYLISLLPTPTTPSSLHTEPLLQALSALIDIFSDETLPTDANFRAGNYLAALVGAVEGVRRAVRGVDRKRERELRRRGEEVRDNLVAFVEYRRGLGL